MNWMIQLDIKTVVLSRLYEQYRRNEREIIPYLIDPRQECFADENPIKFH